MQAVTEGDIIKALSPLLKNTIISSSTDVDWGAVRSMSPTAGAFMAAYLENLGSRIAWAACRECQAEINALCEDGRCIRCQDRDAAKAQLEAVNGDYLRKCLGPWGIQKYSFESFTIVEGDNGNQGAYEACRNFNPDNDNLYLFGKCGTGKTHLAGAVLKHAAAAGKRIKWVTPIFLGRGLRGQWPSEEKAFVDALCGFDVLIIDDLGVGRDSYAILQVVYEILENRRSANRNGLIMTSNWSPKELAKKYDDRLSSRISGLCHLFAVGGLDYRTMDPPARVDPYGPGSDI